MLYNTDFPWPDYCEADLDLLFLQVSHGTCYNNTDDIIILQSNYFIMSTKSPHENTSFMQMRKQRRRSAVQ